MRDSVPGDPAVPAAEAHPMLTGEPGVAAVVLAAGAGRRLRPLSTTRPKPLCPVGNVALLDQALDRARAVTGRVAVNIHTGRAALEAHLDGHPDVHRSVEAAEALGTAGALGRLRSWIGGCGVLVQNADAWTTAALADFVRDWDGDRVRLLVAAGPGGAAPAFGPRLGVVASLLPWSEVAVLDDRPAGLFEVCWRPAYDDGRLETVPFDGSFVDCGTAADYLSANLAAAGADSLVDPTAAVTGGIERCVIGAGARVEGSARRSVVWPGSTVERGEDLVDAVRAGRLTVLVR